MDKFLYSMFRFQQDLVFNSKETRHFHPKTSCSPTKFSGGENKIQIEDEVTAARLLQDLQTRIKNTSSPPFCLWTF